MDEFDNMLVSSILEIQKQLNERAKAAYDLVIKANQHRDEFKGMSFDVFKEVFLMGFFMAFPLIDTASKKG